LINKSCQKGERSFFGNFGGNFLLISGALEIPLTLFIAIVILVSF